MVITNKTEKSDSTLCLILEIGQYSDVYFNEY